MDLATRIAAAHRDRPADPFLKNARVVEVFSGGIEETEAALAGPRIVVLGYKVTGRGPVDVERFRLGPLFAEEQGR